MWTDVALGHAPPQPTVLRLAALPSQVATVHRLVRRADADARIATHVGLGLHTVAFARHDDDALAALAKGVHGLGGHVRVRRLPEDAPPLPLPPPTSAPAMRRVHAALDPDNRCGGRLAWLGGGEEDAPGIRVG
ncbi:MAG: hypothetical protein WEB19_05600 [Acidimicrobiia bacterium]